MSSKASGPDQPHPEQVIDAALSLRDAGRTSEALALVKTAVGRHDKVARLWQLLGVLHRAREESAAAAEAFAAAARLAPADVRIAHSLAQATLESGDAATALFDRAHALAPSDGGLLIGRAAAQLAEGRLVEAIADLDAVLSTNPLWLEGHATLARLRWWAGETAGFDASYRRALAAQPRHLPLWFALLDMHLQAERYAEADRLITAARQATHGPFDAFEAVVASELRDDTRADRLFAGLARSSDVAVAVRHVRHLLRTGRIEAAGARAEPLLDAPDADQLWPYAAIIWRLLGDRRAEWLYDSRLVGVYDISGQVGDLAALADCLRRLHVTAAHPIGQSVRGGTQTDGPLFARREPEFQNLRRRISDAVTAHVQQLKPVDPRHPVLRHVPAFSGVRFAGSWSVRLTGGGHHTSHLHPQGWLSSAFYVVVPPQAASGKPPSGWLVLGAPPAELGLDLPPVRLIEPKPGCLVLFPSIMWHGTVPFDAGERMTAAFDVARPT